MEVRRPTVAIVGGGFGGLYATRTLARADVDIKLIDRRNFHLFQPLLYQVATGSLSPANIASPLRAIVRRQKNCQVLLAEVEAIDAKDQRIIFHDGDIRYDYLILAAGASHSYFGKTEFESLAPGLKTLEDAGEIRRRIFLAFEAAERAQSPEERAAWLTFVVVGGGPTGLELAGALAEIAHHTMKNDFRSISSSDAKIYLVEGRDRILPSYHPVLSEKARRACEQLQVSVRLNTMVASITPNQVVLETSAGRETLGCRTVLWGAGVAGSPLGQRLADSTGCPLDRVGRVMVESDCTIPGIPNIFVIGDLAHFRHQATGEPLPGVAQVAMQQGAYVADVIRRRINQKPAPKPFAYFDKGSMATIGRGKAVADLHWIRFNGYLAWLAWLFIHLIYLIQFQNRLLVLLQWSWSYLSMARSARLITGKSPFPLIGQTVPVSAATAS